MRVLTTGTLSVAARLQREEVHRGDADLFWDEINLQTLLKLCHDRKQCAEQSSLNRRGVWD
jgi:hypothetical protein